MGQSTNAVLFYGYAWDEETSKPWDIGKEYDEEAEDDEEDWEARYARLKGLVKPSVKFPDRRSKNGYGSPSDDEYTPDELAAKNQYVAYVEAKRKLADASACEVDFHCSGDCPMAYVCIKKSQITNFRGSMTIIIPMETLKVEPDWDQQLAAFCDVMGIDVKGKNPAWYMVSYWG